jgi:hypothetical protein
LSSRVRNVKDYLKELNEAKKEKPNQVKEAIDIYIGLWRRTLEKGIVEPTDDIDTALSKIDEKGGLYQASEE